MYKTQGASWDWEKPLPAALGEGGQTCHMECNGKFGHNLVRKVRWGFEPTAINRMSNERLGHRTESS
nr:multiheme c-type cytochrome [Pseudaminobacter arsenicus]